MIRSALLAATTRNRLYLYNRGDCRTNRSWTLRQPSDGHNSLSSPYLPIAPLFISLLPFLITPAADTFSPDRHSMADTSSHRLDLRVGGKYRLGKKIGSGSFGGYRFLQDSSAWLTPTAPLPTYPFLFPFNNRRHLPWDQHHFRRRGRHQARVGQSQTSTTRV